MLLFTNKLFTILAGIALLSSPLTVNAQIIDGAALGNAMKGQFDSNLKELNKRYAEIMKRGLKFDSAVKVIASAERKVSFTVTNTQKDTAHYSIEIFRAPQSHLIFPGEEVDSAGDTTEAKKPKRSMISEEDSVADTAAASYKDLTQYLTVENIKGKIAPGESKTFTVSVNVPTDLPAGSYAAWVTSTVVINPGAKMKAGENKMSTDKEAQAEANDAGKSGQDKMLAGVKVNTFSKVLLEKK